MFVLSAFLRTDFICTAICVGAFSFSQYLIVLMSGHRTLQFYNSLPSLFLIACLDGHCEPSRLSVFVVRQMCVDSRGALGLRVQAVLYVLVVCFTTEFSLYCNVVLNSTQIKLSQHLSYKVYRNFAFDTNYILIPFTVYSSCSDRN